MTVLWIDLESRSRCDLPARGLYNYAADPSTEIVIASYALDMGPIRHWSRFTPGRDIKEVQEWLRRRDVEVRAHNAAFERLLIAHVWKIAIAPERCYCTSFQARACALPGALEDIGRALTSKLRKDPRGHELIRLLSKPQADGSFNEDPKLYQEFADYCDHDVNVMRYFSCMMPALTPEARATYTANEVVNDRGLPIDLDLCRWATAYAEEERAAAEEKVRTVTNGALSKARGTKLTDWIFDRMPDDVKAMMTVTRRRTTVHLDGGETSDDRSGSKKLVHTGDTYTTRTLAEAVREAIFSLAEERPAEFDPDAMAVLEANDAATSASVYKFRAMLNFAGKDGRLRGAFIANGAAGTGRFSSKGAQVHNFPRKCAEDPEAIRKIMAVHGTLPGPVLEILKSMLRAAICPGAGRVIVRADWNSIEARVLPWLTKDPSANRVLEAFMDPSRDVYIEQAQACGLGDHPRARDAGKVLQLAFGFGGAVGAMDAMSKSYTIVIEGDRRQLVETWRYVNPWAPRFWHGGERRARWALSGAQPESARWLEIGRVAYARDTVGEVPGLRMRLPSGRILYYPFAGPPLDEEGQPLPSDSLEYLKAMWKPKADAKTWPRARFWGGLLAENATQATAADLLRAALTDAVAEGLPVIGHCHDEIILECRDKDAARHAKQLEAIMLTERSWAKGLPLAVEIDVAPRYRK